MKKRMIALLTVVAISALVAGGCANKEVVKSEEAMIPKAEAAKVEVAKPEIVKPIETPKPVEQAVPVEQAPVATQVEQAVTAPVADSRFETVYFDFDKSDLRQDARDVLSKNAEIILKSPVALKVQIEGHCDERGSAEYNLALGERRAKSTVKYLTTLGVRPDILSTISYGKEKPAVQGNNEAAWAKNRRAEFVIVK
ncbi:MAG: peptidoglycan-associated lipoprotein Pal [Geobacter sp.]|nr:peptidoglycan-associated lipoprotein Pal [Geobacter sp.]